MSGVENEEICSQLRADFWSLKGNFWAYRYHEGARIVAGALKQSQTYLFFRR
jgi:hypothetical protein